MSDISRTELLQDATGIRQETATGANTADRVGKMFEDIIKYIGTNETSWSTGGSGGGGDADLSDYYNKSQVNSLLSAKQNTLVSSPAANANIKTINNQSILGSGNISIEDLGGGAYLRKDQPNTAQTVEGKVIFAKGLDISNGGANITGDVAIDGNLSAENITGTHLESTGTITADSNITTTHGDINVDLGNVNVPNGKVDTKDLEATNGEITNLTSTNITTEFLTVTKQAHFFELIIDQLRSQKGALLITCGQCTADVVEPLPNATNPTSWKVYYRATDGDKNVYQSFVTGDQAICMAFGDVHVGTMQNVTTKYYWRYVMAVSSNTTTTKNDGVTPIDSDNNSFHWIQLSASDCDTNSGAPESGDEIVQLGYRGTGTDSSTAARQSAIIISAYTTPDTELIPASMAFYAGIGRDQNYYWNLKHWRQTYFHALGATIVGDLRVVPGGELDTYIDGKTRAEGQDYTDTKYAWSTASSTSSATVAPTISGTWSATIPNSPGENYYLWMQSTRYTWDSTLGTSGGYVAQTPTYARLSGEKGANASGSGYTLIPVLERFFYDGTDVHVELEYNILLSNSTGDHLMTVSEYNALSTSDKPLIKADVQYVDGTLSSDKVVLSNNSSSTGSLILKFIKSDQISEGSDGWNKDNLSSLRVKLLLNSKVINSSTVIFIFTAGATQEIINDGIDSYIRTNVQGTLNELEGTTQTLSRQYTEVVQNMSSITSRVADVEADYSTIDGELENVTQSVSQIQQTANNISLTVSQQSSENDNYLQHSEFSSDGWVNEAWNKEYPTFSTVTSSNPILHHAWRYSPSTTCPAATSLGLSSANKCAILSSYITAALGGENSAVSVQPLVNIASSGTYTFSVWVKRYTTLKDSNNNPKNVNIGIGFPAGLFTLVDAKVYTAAGTSEDASVSVNKQINSENVWQNYVSFSLADTSWHLLVVVVDTNISYAVNLWVRSWGSADGTYAEIYVSRPCFRSGNGINDSTARTYINSTVNLIPNSILNSASVVNRWPLTISATIDNTTKLLSYSGSTISQDTLSEYVNKRLFSTQIFKNSVLMPMATLGLLYSTTTSTDYRANSIAFFWQNLSASVGTELQGKTLVFSAYVRRVVQYDENTYLGATLQNIPELGLRVINANSITYKGKDVDTPISVSNGGETISGSSQYDASKMVRVDITDTNWHRVWVRFTLNTTASSNGFGVGFHANNSQGVGDDWIITKPKLEIGEVPSAWTDYHSEDIKEGLIETGIDISVGKITLSADNVEVAKDLTIGGNTRVGGFIYNIQNEITTADIAHLCYNPLLYGAPDKYMFGVGSSINYNALRKKAYTITFPECTSSFKLTSNFFTSCAESVGMGGDYPICLNLPFYYPLRMTNLNAGPTWPSDTLFDRFGITCWSASGIDSATPPEILKPTSSSNVASKFLIEQIRNAQTICRRYLGSTVTIENTSADSKDIVYVFGVKGMIGSSSSTEYLLFEPWNRATALITVSDYNDTQNPPKLKEVERTVEGVKNSLMTTNGTAPVTSTPPYITTYRQGGVVQNNTISTVKLQARQLIGQPDVFCTEYDNTHAYNSDTLEGTFIDVFGLVDGSGSDYRYTGKQLPFLIEPAHFARLKLVYEPSEWNIESTSDGYFYWIIEAYGKIPTESQS